MADAALQDKGAAPWSDLSAAYLAKAERVPARRIEYLSRALEAAATSMKLAPSNEALFNRALAIDGLTPFVGDSNPWANYLETERDPRWLATAKRHDTDDPPAADVRDRWNARQQELRTRLAGGDRTFVHETVELFPEASLELFEQDLLVEWARYTTTGDETGAQSIIEQAQLLADAIHSVTRDPMSSEEVARLKSAGRILAQAHLAYADGVQQYDGNDYSSATDSFERARDGFTQARSPYRAWTGTQLATILFQQRDLTAANRLLNDVERFAGDRKYLTLLGRTLRIRGLVYSKQWRLTEALAAFRAAASSFEGAGQLESGVALHSHLADTLRTLGEQQDSWVNIGRTLEGLARIRKPLPRYLFLYNAALFAQSQELFEAALLFQNAAVREASRASTEAEVDAFTQRALVHLRKGDQPAARLDLNRALKQLKDIPAGALRTYLEAEINVLMPRMSQAAGSDAARAGMQSAITFFKTAEPARMPGLHLNLARLHLAVGDVTAAEQAMAEGIALLETQQATMGDEALKISYFDEAWGLFEAMIGLQLASRRDPVRAFEYAERSRARSLLAAAGGPHDSRPLRLDEIQRALPRSVVLVYYIPLTDRLLVWTVTSSASQLAQSEIRHDELRRLIVQHRSAMVERRSGEFTNDRLYDVLIRPVTGVLPQNSTIVFVPDGALQQLPFATLRDPATGRFLLEDHGLLTTPSASFFTVGLSRLRQLEGQPMASALLVGNPAGVTDAALPGAAAEAAAAAPFYARHVLLTGRAATKSEFMKAAPHYDVIHFGGHAFVNAEYPLLSRLSFSSEGNPQQQPLFAHEISQIQFSRTHLVILAACSTAVGAVSRGEGVVSVARPFLGAGVPVVVASQWDVDDRATSQLFVAFHRALVETQDPVKALRTAQLTLLHSHDSLLASPESWGAFVALGATAH